VNTVPADVEVNRAHTPPSSWFTREEFHKLDLVSYYIGNSPKETEIELFVLLGKTSIKVRVRLRFDRQFDLRFGVCAGTPTQENALSDSVTCQCRHRIEVRIVGHGASGHGPYYTPFRLKQRFNSSFIKRTAHVPTLPSFGTMFPCVCSCPPINSTPP
jgi:hypothetical protein